MQNVILAVLAGIVFIYVVVVEVLDWAGRIDYLASKFPRITRFLDRLVESKKTRLALLGLAFLLLLRVSYELATTPRDVSPSTPSTSAPTNIEEVNQLRQQVRTLEADKAVKERAIETLGLVSVNPVRESRSLRSRAGAWSNFKHPSGVWAIRYACGAGCEKHEERIGPLKSDAIRAYHDRRARGHAEPGWCPAVGAPERLIAAVERMVVGAPERVSVEPLSTASVSELRQNFGDASGATTERRVGVS